MKWKLMTLLFLVAAFIGYTFIFSQKSNYSISHQTSNTKIEKVIGVTGLDMTVINIFQKFSKNNHFIDELLVFISKNSFFKGGLLIIAFWWLWFPPNNQVTSERRVKIILGLLSGFLAIFIGRVLVLCMPFRVRPINNPDLHLVLPYGTDNIGLDKLSSFPSDHAVLFYAIVTSLFLIARKAGILAFLYTIIFITFSRVYLGFHYATDVIVGALIGITVSYFIFNNKYAQKLGEKIYGLSIQKSQFFYPAFFIISFELANLFEDMRAGITFLTHYA